MKYKITIPKPCSENWDSMTSAEKGRHCAVCDKTVHDFSSFTKSELQVFLEENKGVCGKIPTKLLDFPMAKERSSYAATIALAAVLSVSPAMAQNNERGIEIGVSTEITIMGDVAVNPSFDEFLQERQVIIKGKVVDANDKVGLPGVAVFLSSHPERNSTVYADFEGVFEFEVPEDIELEDVILKFSFLGYTDQYVTPKKVMEFITVKLEEEALGEVEVFTVGKAKVKKEKLKKKNK